MAFSARTDSETAGRGFPTLGTAASLWFGAHLQIPRLRGEWTGAGVILQEGYHFKDEGKGEVRDYLDFYHSIDFDPVEQSLPDRVRTLTFVLGGMLPYSGGRTSVLKLGTYLSQKGYQVAYLSYKPQSVEEMERNAELNLPGYLGKILPASALESYQSDVWIATFWESAYVIKNLHGYKMYFVQDYEPYFYDYGDQYLLAKKTYDLNLHMVSLGPWNKAMIEKNCSPLSPVDSIPFAFEPADYPEVPRDFRKYPQKKELSIAVYNRPTARRAPIITQLLMKRLEEQLQNEGITLHVYYYGSPLGTFFANGTNLGKLNKSELFKLYAKCDFGMVASMSNISLVPFEMMHTGLPVMEFADGTLPYFFEKGSALLTSMDFHDFSRRFHFYLKRPKELEKMTAFAKKQLKRTNWQRTAAAFAQIVGKIDGQSKNDSVRFGSLV